MAPTAPITPEQTACGHCGLHHAYDSERRCWQCDGGACLDCSGVDPQQLCPECRFGSLPAPVEAMLARPGELPSDEAEWSFEFKWDGMRALCFYDDGKTRFQNRRLLDVTLRYPDLVARKAQLSAQQLILDGEIVAPDSDGRPSFSRLSRRMRLQDQQRIAAQMRRVPLRYYIFDILYHDGTSLIDLPYRQRRQHLLRLDLQQPRWQVPAARAGAGGQMLQIAKQWRLEGLVAKRLDSRYQPGARSADWRKIKLVQQQELVIGGWEPQRDNPHAVGSLLVGHYTPQQAGLRYAGRVGSGFGAATHALLIQALQDLQRDHSPFVDPPPGRGLRHVDPLLVAQVAYRRWPAEGHLQQASFQGLRDDVEAADICLPEAG